ncbi:MAG: carbohydrate kinase family protein [Candidatus Shapirobacteria bacterium]|nr:carbohydrate kinase family protein [Candidatus Shapirobacteria bacterium]
MYDVISIGSATIDIFVKSDQFSIQKKILNIPASSKNEINQSLFCSGGGGTNSSVSFSRLGLKSACLSLIGDSHLNNFIFDDLKKNKVDSQFIVQNKKDITDFSIILVAFDGSRSILTNRGKFGLEEKHIKWNKIKDTKWFYITSLEGNIDLLEKIIGFAREFNIKICFNPGNRELSQRKKLFPLIKMIDVLLLNQEEAEVLIDISHQSPQFWDNLHCLQVPLIAVTNGRLGAHILFDQKQLYSPIINTHPVDETGAGDSFGSAFISALIYNKDPKDALHWGVKNSASVVSSLGAKTTLLTLNQIKK